MVAAAVARVWAVWDEMWRNKKPPKESGNKTKKPPEGSGNKEKVTWRKWQKRKSHLKKVATAAGAAPQLLPIEKSTDSCPDQDHQWKYKRSELKIWCWKRKFENGVLAVDQFVMSSIVPSQYIVFVPIWSNDWWDLSILGLLSRILESLIKVGYPSRFKSFLSDF